MAKLSRRDFLRLLAAGAGATAIDQFLTACGLKKNPEQVIPATRPALPTDTQIPPSATHASQAQAGTTAATPAEATALPATATSQPTLTLEPIPDLVVARGGEPEALVRQALQALGGINQFVKAGDYVIIKPNLCTARPYEYAATTNPWVVATLVKLCLEAGAGKVQVMDYPFGSTIDEAYKVSGVMEQVKAAGGEMAYMPGYKYVKTDIPQGLDLKSFYVFGDVLKANVLINVPIAKNHDLAKLTLGMKNLMGVIRDRQAIHLNLGQRLADITSRLRPALTVVDAVRILTANGPTGGNLKDVKKIDTLIASPDIVAADSYAATLFGMQPEDLSYVVKGVAMGLGRSDLGSLRIKELNLAS